MAIGSILQNIFGGQPTQAPPANPNAPTGNPTPGQPLPGTVANSVTAPNGMIPDNSGVVQPAPGQNPAPEPSPFDAFKDVWQSPTNPDPNANPNIFGNLDPNKVMESARRVDFNKAITPANLQRIQAGGQDAMAALMESMNSVAQTVYAQSAMATTKIVEQALTKQSEKFNADLLSMVRKFSVNENIAAENPIFKNPALAPLVGALTEQFSRKAPPGTTAQEIQQQVGDYFKAIGGAFAPAAPETSATRAAASRAQTDDWSKFLE